MAKKTNWRRWITPIAEICSIASFATFLVHTAWAYWPGLPMISKIAVIMGIIFAAIALSFRAYDRMPADTNQRKTRVIRLPDSDFTTPITQGDVVLISAYVTVGLVLLTLTEIWIEGLYHAFRVMHPQASWYQWFEWWNR